MKKFVVLHWEYGVNEKRIIPIYIDPSQVLFIRENILNKKSTVIAFSTGSSIVVVEPVSEVIKKVWGIS